MSDPDYHEDGKRVGHHVLQSDPRSEAVRLIRRLVDHVDVIPAAERGGPIELPAHGRLAELTVLAKRVGNGSPVQVVAGEGFEPPTLGL